MFLFQAEGKDFRNYRSFSVAFQNNLNFFVGDNGQGKTSFLEALFTALRGRSFKPNIGAYFIREREDQALVRLRFRESQGESLVESALYVKEGRLCRDLSFCGKKVSRSFLEKRFPLLFWIGEKLETIKGGSAEKRKLIDEMLVFDGQRAVVERFQRSLKEKTSLLWNYKRGLCSETEARKTLEAINGPFLQASFNLMESRAGLLERVFKKAPGIFPQHQTLDYRYEICGQIPASKEEARALIEEDLFKKAALELDVGRVLSGSGKHDIFFLFNGRNSRVFCSQGQQRVFILSLLMSQVFFVKNPLIFLDDVLSELDEGTRKKLLSFLEETACQVFITNHKKIDINLKKVSFFNIKSGTINP